MQLNVKLEVPQKLRKFLANPTPFVNETMQAADKEALNLLKTDISAAAPKGKSKKLSQSITVDLEKRKVYSPLVYARAVELGHYAEPVNTPKKMFLHFTDVREVFLKFVRTKKQPFFFKTFYADKIKIMDIYDKAFERMLKKI